MFAYRILTRLRENSVSLFFTVSVFLLLTIPILAEGPARRDLIFQKTNDYTYGLVLPVNYQPSRKYILAICLHGLGGNGIEFSEKLGYYTRYMNILLACPNGNIPDPNRNASMWGMANSHDYILNFVNYIRDTYSVYPEVLLIGFSQGGNQGIQTALLQPTLFPYFIGVSGGYTNISEEFISNLEEVKVLLLSGDTGSGESYTKSVMDQKYKLYKSYPFVKRKVVKGEEHKITSKLSYTALHWFASVNKAYKKRFWIFKGDYYRFFEKGEAFKKNYNYKESLVEYKKSFKYNPVFPPAHLGYAHSSLLSGSLTHFHKSFFKVLELYSLFPEYEPKEVFTMFEDIYKTIYSDKNLQEFFLRFLSEKIETYNDSIAPIYKAEIYFLLSKITMNLNDTENQNLFIDKAKFYYSQLDKADYLYKVGSVKEKLDIIKKLR